MSNSNGPFGFDPEDLDRMVREAGEGLRDALEGLGRFVNTPGERTGWSVLFDEFSRGTRPRTRPETTGEAGDGVWAIFTVDGEGGARIEQVYPTELDALRANKDNTDPTRRVRFLPYGIAVSVLDSGPDSNPDAGVAGSPDQHS
ncbi:MULTISPECIES: hypothetical protein [Mycolicibacterium]|uniref:Transmembrane protein n=2 Tax=Mycolicibacterium gilvum TaxID=1804 RepID=E6TN40_MYCSR|nr:MULTISPECIES: hypothetical protein [Mycolicibacterium]ABP45908.1 conserved hypothetical protein [Mycolicibacterium gilvum PYR-GCK]ADT99398.1 hypothetical protein Mspyr1_27690 [Mycolicibacterium gilvum Spyr1]MBV5246208.1 hypothetical protein [Mycolicibacterium sp. PAM1]